MRIVVVIKTSVGGLWLMPHLEEMRKRGHEVAVVLPTGPGRLAEALHQGRFDVRPTTFDFRFRPSIGTLRGIVTLRRQLARLAPDVVHYHLYASALATRFATLGWSVPRVHMVAGPLYLESAVIRRLERLLVKLDTVTIGGSAFTAARYRELGRSEDVAPAIPYGLDCRVFAPAAPEDRLRARLTLRLPADAFVVVMVAWVYAPKRAVHRGQGIKGHDLLLGAWQTFSRRHPEARLVLLGSGFDPEGEAYRDLLRATFPIAGGDSVLWLDSVEDVRAVYSAADLSVSPSRSENHGAAVEAGAMGVPSVVTDVGGLPEAIAPGAGWVVAPESVAELLGAMEEASALGTEALARCGERARAHIVAHFDRESCAEAVVDTLERAAGREVASVFAEARVGLDGEGHWAAKDAANGPGSWLRYRRVRSYGEVRAVVRADRQRGSGHIPLPGVTVKPLPYYVGLPGLLRAGGPLALEVWRQVGGAERIILRLPGVIGGLAAVACRLRRRRYAVEVVGDPVDVLAAGVLGRWGRLARGLAGSYFRWVIAGASSSLYVTRGELQRRYPPRSGSPSAAMTRALLDDADFVSAPRRFVAESTRVITVGSQEQHYKGHDVLLRALHLLDLEGTPIPATIVGDGRRHAELRVLSEELGLDHLVTFEGAVHDRRRIRELLDGSTVFVLPSRAEGTSRALLEAMARGLPAVGTRVGGTVELLAPEALCASDDVEGLARGSTLR